MATNKCHPCYVTNELCIEPYVRAGFGSSVDTRESSLGDGAWIACIYAVPTQYVRSNPTSFSPFAPSSTSRSLRYFPFLFPRVAARSPRRAPLHILGDSTKCSGPIAHAFMQWRDNFVPTSTRSISHTSGARYICTYGLKSQNCRI